MNKIVVVGIGNVGKAYAYNLLNQNTKLDELILIDIDNKTKPDFPIENQAFK